MVGPHSVSFEPDPADAVSFKRDVSNSPQKQSVLKEKFETYKKLEKFQGSWERYMLWFDILPLDGSERRYRNQLGHV